MPHSGPGPLELVADRLRATPVARLPYQHDVVVRSFLLERPEGNTLIYNSPGLTESADAIRELGGATRLLINHAHEAMYGAPDLDVPAYVHERDRAGVVATLPIAGVFRNRELTDHDMEIIPTPGHTAGTTSFLWDSGAQRFLFTGDFVWIEHGEWKAVVLDDGLRPEYLDSLALIRDLEFDVLVPWGTTDDGPSVGPVRSRTEIRERIDAIIDRVRAGGNR